MSKTAASPMNPADESKAKKPRTSVAKLRFGPVDNFVLLTAKVHAEQLRPGGTTIHTVTRNTPVSDLFLLLIRNNILSVPVLNKRGKYYGFVDCMDIVVFASNLFANWQDFNMKDFDALLAKESRFCSATVKDIMLYPVKKETPFHPVHVGTSLFTVWELLAKEGLHRVPILNAKAEIQDIITQSMMIDFLWQNIETITTAKNLTVGSLDPSLAPLAIINQNEKAIVAFRQMIHNDYSGLAVVDGTGKLVDNISIRDLRGFGYDANSFWRLWNPISELKSRAKVEFPNVTPEGPIFVLKTDTLETVINKLAVHRIHRLFVVDDPKSMKPIRVITQTDVLKQLLKLEPIYPVHA